MDLCIVCMIV